MADNRLYAIHKITPDGEIITLLDMADEPNRQVPFGIAVDTSGTVYTAVTHSILKISPDGTVLTLAGSGEFGFADGPGMQARFYFPYGIDVDGNGILYVADYLNCKIRRIAPDGSVTTLAGSVCGSLDGPAEVAQFEGPVGVTVDDLGHIWVAESSKIRKITPDGNVTTVAGTIPGYLDGPVAESQFYNPRRIAIDANGNLIIADSNNFVVRRIGKDGSVLTVAGSLPGNVDGSGTIAQFCQPLGLALGTNGEIYLTQGSGCGGIRKIVFD